METLRFQKIRACVQCEEILSLKCERCLKHPDRKPRVIELYEWPPILRVGPCGCLLIACQAPGCRNTKWRYPRLHSKEGKAVSQTFCCSPKCAAKVAASTLKTSIEVACACGCGKKFTKQPAVLKLRRHVYFSQEHHYKHVRRMNFETKQKKLIIAEKDNLALLECWGGCREITEHTRRGEISKGNVRHECNVCHFIRNAHSSPINQSDTVTLGRKAAV